MATMPSQPSQYLIFSTQLGVTQFEKKTTTKLSYIINPAFEQQIYISICTRLALYQSRVKTNCNEYLKKL
jgi:hypothetical protein